MTSKVSWAVLVVVLVSAGIAAAALAATHHRASHGAAAIKARASSAILADYGVLSRPQAAADAIDPTLHPASLPVSPSSARNLSLPASVGQAWLSADDRYTCLSVSAAGAATSCTHTADLPKGLALTLGPLQDGSLVVVGVVPDGVANVDLGLKDGTVKRLVVSDNAFATVVHGATASASYSVGSQVVTVPMPSYGG